MMNRCSTVSGPIFVVAILSLSSSGIAAQEIYKWTDSNGKVHYGDRSGAPENSAKMNVTFTPPNSLTTAPPSAAGSVGRPPLQAQLEPPKKAVPVDPAVVAPECKGLIEKIAAVPVGKNWESLSRQFNQACPGIAYECVEYQSHPQNNRCIWIKRSGSNLLNTNRYP